MNNQIRELTIDELDVVSGGWDRILVGPISSPPVSKGPGGPSDPGPTDPQPVKSASFDPVGVRF
jgi:hypothetical protein